MSEKRSASSSAAAEPKKAKVEVGDEESYNFKVSPHAHSNVTRVIQAGAHHTLEDLANAILASVNYENNQVAAFFLDNTEFSKAKDQAWHNEISSRGPFMKDKSLKSLKLAKGTTILYLFDFGNPVKFEVTVEAVNPAAKPLATPNVVKREGELPPQDTGDDANEEFDEEDDEDEEDEKGEGGGSSSSSSSSSSGSGSGSEEEADK